MDKTRVILFASVVAAALVFGGVVGATAARSPFTPASAALAVLTAASPSPSFHSNEDATHESGESAAQEQAENNGTFHPGAGPDGHPCGGHSNEASSHESSESAAIEAAENAACPSPGASPSASTSK
jgi:hypothetical protein